MAAVVLKSKEEPGYTTPPTSHVYTGVTIWSTSEATAEQVTIVSLYTPDVGEIETLLTTGMEFCTVMLSSRNAPSISPSLGVTRTVQTSPTSRFADGTVEPTSKG